MRNGNNHQQGGHGHARRSAGSRASRNIDDHLPEPHTQNSHAMELAEEEQEPIFFTGPPRVSLSPPTQTRSARQTSSGTGQIVHSFHLDGFTAVTTGGVPFMRVVPPRQATTDNQPPMMASGPGGAGQQDPLSMGLDRIDRMMNAAMSTTGPAAQYFSNHNILLNQPQQTPVHGRRGGVNAQASPLRNKIVYQLECCYCQTHICGRAMRAILLADTKIELYSTDVPPGRLRLLDDDRMTQGCNCRIRDTACGTCGNVMGYHVSQPCEKCLEARNNGHFWMFYSDTVVPKERQDPSNTGKPLYWGALSQASDLLDIGGLSKNGKPYECFCR